MSGNKCRIVFMGTPDFAVTALEALLDAGYEVAAVVSQPDRPKGRKRMLTPPPVKAAAEKHGIPVLQPEKLRAPESVEDIRRLRPDLIVTAAYGQILPKSVLELPQFGCINVHASLLPKYRGGAPIHYAVINGESKTGVTIMYMAEGLDTGDMISKIEVPITSEDTTGTLHDKLSAAGAELLIETVPKLLAGTASREPQDDALASYAPNITREDERIDWSKSAAAIHNQVRGLNPWPVAFTTLDGQVWKIWRTEVVRTDAAPDVHRPAGAVVSAEDGRIVVQTGTGHLALLDIQPQGKRPMPTSEWLKGGKLAAGTVLGGSAS
ncbi:methionyl-tRNA formyltransferase [Xylanibacillus composti]|uniref:Methionyl-tRNA formyltransferase n=1 Tax=Xylanibacillus composti TaxID=1572762 RepID=A0A8J4H2C0_9BACL|nr:methionyl-tRNA formyltransferase [Xylanibacillus composti]MDT9725596.1 methionyl-tRNA formyltransferase [Xylanibacillus composti]GIQ67689.1 methionyl-tRNA formyltransferase [Xylanibacillus composti]